MADTPAKEKSTYNAEPGPQVLRDLQHMRQRPVLVYRRHAGSGPGAPRPGSDLKLRDGGPRRSRFPHRGRTAPRPHLSRNR